MAGIVGHRVALRLDVETFAGGCGHTGNELIDPATRKITGEPPARASGRDRACLVAARRYLGGRDDDCRR
jgi:hypothetical protein